MILYLDTSALVKLFVSEPASDLVVEFTASSDTIVTSRIAYVEACSALARRRRERLLDARAHLRAQKALRECWDDLVTVELDEFEAGTLTSKHDLGAFDAVHLAAALKVRAHSRDIPFQFCSFDDRQRTAAVAENFVVIPDQV